MPRLSVGSKSFSPLPLSLDPDAVHPLATSPGELLAGAVGGVFAWFAAEELVKEGTQARELIASVTLTLSGESDDGLEMALSGIACRLAGFVPSVDQERLEVVAQAAMTRCIEALGMRAQGIDVTVEALLEGA
jgi:organic hydroperoxide reductase OsmC/OhrA